MKMLGGGLKCSVGGFGDIENWVRSTGKALKLGNKTKGLITWAGLSRFEEISAS